MTSRQPSAPASIGAMPALATTMSSRPNSSSPACNAPASDALIANVGLARDDSRAGVLDELDRGGQIVGGGHRIGHRRDLVADVDRDDVRAVGRQPDRLGAALTAGGAGDERDFACEGAIGVLASARALVRAAAGPWPGRPRRRAAAS